MYISFAKIVQNSIENNYCTYFSILQYDMKIVSPSEKAISSSPNLNILIPST